MLRSFAPFDPTPARRRETRVELCHLGDTLDQLQRPVSHANLYKGTAALGFLITDLLGNTVGHPVFTGVAVQNLVDRLVESGWAWAAVIGLILAVQAWLLSHTLTWLRHSLGPLSAGGFGSFSTESLLHLALGLLLGSGAALLAGAQLGSLMLESWGQNPWNNHIVNTFQTIELFVLAALALTIGLLSRSRLWDGEPLCLRLCNSAGHSHQGGGLWLDYRHSALPPVSLIIDRNAMDQITVLCQQADGDFSLFPRDQPMDLARHVFFVIDHRALEARLGAHSYAFSDAGGFCRLQIRYLSRGLSLDGSRPEAAIRLPAAAVRVVAEALLNAPRPTDTCNLLLAEVLNDYLGEAGGCAQDYLDRFAALRRSAHVDALDALGGQARSYLDHPSQLALTQLISLQTYAARVTALMDELQEAWTGVRRLLRASSGKLQQAFSRRLEEDLLARLGPGEAGSHRQAVACLLDCTGLTLMVETQELADGAAAACEQMEQTLLDDITRREEEATRLATEVARELLGYEHAFVAELLKASRDFAPYLAGMGHEQLLTYLDRLVQLGAHGRRRELERLQGSLGHDGPATTRQRPAPASQGIPHDGTTRRHFTGR